MGRHQSPHAAAAIAGNVWRQTFELDDFKTGSWGNPNRQSYERKNARLLLYPPSQYGLKAGQTDSYVTV